MAAFRRGRHNLASTAMGRVAGRGRSAACCLFISHLWDPHPYANRFWGGPDNTHNLLTDSNVDWGQQLHQVRNYLAQRNVKYCWFSYIGEFATRFEYWGIPCKAMPNLDALPPDYPAGAALSSFELIPKEIDGPVLISADELSGYLTGPGPLNPFGDFQKLKPSANLGAGVLVYDGHFAVPKLASLTLRLKVAAALKADPNRGVEMARQVVALDPDSVASWIMLGRALQGPSRPRMLELRLSRLSMSLNPCNQSFRRREFRRYKNYSTAYRVAEDHVVLRFKESRMDLAETTQ